MKKTITIFALAINLWLAPVSYSQSIEYHPIAKVGGDTPQQANKPSNAIDGNLATRWSGQWNPGGTTPALILDLGSPKNVNFIEIAWHEGSSRATYFNIEAMVEYSGFLGYYGGASDLTDDFQYYPFSFVETRFIRILGYGNSSPRAKTAAWTSIAEVRVGFDPDGSLDWDDPPACR